jgi:predicted membrane channel-forming protein YqfA (hemolysin III family)
MVPSLVIAIILLISVIVVSILKGKKASINMVMGILLIVGGIYAIATKFMGIGIEKETIIPLRILFFILIGWLVVLSILPNKKKENDAEK